MAIKPLRDWVLVEMMDGKRETESGIIVPDNARQDEGRAKIVELGEGRSIDNKISFYQKEEGYVLGDIVLINQYAGHPVKHGGREYKLIQDEDIRAVIRD